MSARLTSRVFVALGFADLAVLNFGIAPRFAAEKAAREARSMAVEGANRGAPVEAPSAAPARAPERSIEDPRPVAAPTRAAEPVIIVPFELQSELVTHLPAARALIEIAHELRRDPSLRARLRGHTDRLGRAASNLALSRRRAEAVKRYLMMHGAPEDRMTIEAIGAEEPADPGDTPAAWAKNRRVEVLVR